LCTGLIALGSPARSARISGSVLEIRGSTAGAQALTFNAAGAIDVATAALAAVTPINKIGAGTVNLQVASGLAVAPLNVNQGTFSINGAGTTGATGLVTVDAVAPPLFSTTAEPTSTTASVAGRSRSSMAR